MPCFTSHGLQDIKDEIIDRDQRKECNRVFGGRPRKLSLREERHILRTLSSMRHEEGIPASIRLMERAGISPKHVSNRTIRRFLEREGYYFLQARKKGPLSEKDLEERLKFAKNIRKDYSKDMWKDNVAFHLDCVSFWYKRNPADQASAPHGCIWRRKGEDFMRGCALKEGGGGGAKWKAVEKLGRLLCLLVTAKVLLCVTSMIN